MGFPQDKTFASATNPPQDEAFSPPTPDPASAWLPTVPGAVDPEAPFPNPFHRAQIEPDQALALGLEVNQFLNEQTLVFKAMGEAMLVYRQKKFGQTCACVDPATNQPQDGCRICFMTRFVGGYDMIGETAGYIGSSPMARKLTELGITLESKPKLYLLPSFVVRDRDFVLAKAESPVTDIMRFQAEPVVRGALDPNIDPLAKLNARKVLKISKTNDGAVLSVPNPLPISTPDNGYDLPPQVGGGEDFTEGVDFILTGGELTVDNALTAPPNADSRVLRVLGKRAPLFPPSGETLAGQTIPDPTLYANAGLSAGLPATAFNRAAQPQAFSTTLTVGAGADAGFFLITLTGATGSGISNQANFPATDFLVTVAGSGILWLAGGARPTLTSTYYVSYEAALNVTMRYQLQNVTPYRFQGVVVAQDSDIQLMDQTHPIYGINSVYDLGAPLDRQVADEDNLRKQLGQAAGLVTSAPNNADSRFVNPSDFL
jgi:hypothetical protein